MGHCRECGFDLAGLGDRPGRCPECGTNYADPDAWNCAPLPRLGLLFLVACLPTAVFAGASIELGGSIGAALWLGAAGVLLMISYWTARVMSRGIASACFPSRVRMEREVALRGGILAANIAIILFAGALVFA